MSTNTHRQGRNKSLKERGIPKNNKIIRNNTIISPDNQHILLEKGTLIRIANNISNKTGDNPDINSLINFIRLLDYTKLYNKNYDYSINYITDLWVAPNIHKPNLYIDGLDSETPTVTDYLKRQALYMTDNENQYKFTQNAARRGDSIIYTDLQNKIKDNTRQLHKISDEEFKGKLLNGIQNLENFFNPQNIDSLVRRAGAASPGLQTYQNITFPHRLIRLDSRNKLQSSTDNCIQWNLNFSGHQGQIGNIYVQDTIKEIKRMQLFSFWLPITDPRDIFYDTISMYIKEFWDASVTTDVLPTETNIEKYHFQFKIQTVTSTRVYLEPVQPFYYFNKSIKSLDKISVVFYNPFSKITFDPMEGVFAVTNGVLTSFATVDGSAHNLATNDLVYILNYNSTDANINSEINDTRGQIITVTGIDSFTIAVDTSALAPVANVDVVYGSKRIFLQLEFTSLEH